MKENMRKIFIGLVVGILICALLYALLDWYFKTGKAIPTSGNEIEKTVDEETKESEEETTEEEAATETATDEDVVLTPENYSNQELAKTLLKSEDLVPNNVEQLWRDMIPELMTIGQGNYTDGTYWYQAYAQRDTASSEFKNKCIVVKYDLATGERLKTSEEYQLNHCNDITYNSKLGYLVICHNSPVNNCVSYMDPETLELIDTFPIDTFFYSIDYNEKTDRYVMGLSGGQTFQIFDGDFNPISEVFQPTNKTKGYTTQGCSSDDDFIYFALYNPNAIAVYDWDGNFVTVIDAGFTSMVAEPEGITVIDGEIYIGAMSNGHTDLRVYKISDFVPKPEEASEE